MTIKLLAKLTLFARNAIFMLRRIGCLKLKGKMSHKVEHKVTLKGGHVAEDPRLGRLPQFDPRSKGYPIMAMLPDQEQRGIRGCNWYLKLRLDQLQTSACTGFARTFDLHASPEPLRKPDGKQFDYNFAYALYKVAQQHDEWAGEEYEGSSVLGALKAAEQLGYVGEYRWAFGIDDVLATLAWLGPVVVGTDWLDSMFDPRPNGLLEVQPHKVSGGHSYILRNIIVSKSSIKGLLGRGERFYKNTPLIRGTNSWGIEWGRMGEFFIWAHDLEVLLEGVQYPGEAAIVTKPLQPSKEG